jgi:hypothetical protein
MSPNYHEEGVEYRISGDEFIFLAIPLRRRSPYKTSFKNPHRHLCRKKSRYASAVLAPVRNSSCEKGSRSPLDGTYVSPA